MASGSKIREFRQLHMSCIFCNRVVLPPAEQEFTLDRCLLASLSGADRQVDKACFKRLADREHKAVRKSQQYLEFTLDCCSLVSLSGAIRDTQYTIRVEKPLLF